ncbi:MAG TPA: sigma-70 family RNA polymerase sigma factor [candidate division Zixibacteria bacterium]
MIQAAVTDRELMEKIRQRDDSAFEELVNRYKKKLFNLIYRMLNDRNETEDILQETFLRVYRERESYDPHFCFSTWVYTIALNLTKNELKKRSRFKFLELSIIQNDRIYSREDEQVDSGLKNLLENTMNKLPTKYKAALVMREVNQLSYEEMSDILKVPLGTIKSRVNRARNMLQKKLKPKLMVNYEVSKA